MGRQNTVVTLRSAGVAVVVDVEDDRPEVLHWGRDLGELSEDDVTALRMSAAQARVANTPEARRRLTLLPVENDGWAGQPGAAGHRNGRATALRPRLVDVVADERQAVFTFDDAAACVSYRCQWELDEDGVLEARLSLHVPTDAEAAPFEVAQLLAMMPIPARATELLDFSGRWSRERTPQRRALTDETHLRDVRRGKPGLDAPHLMLAGVAGFTNRSGEVWGMHVAWSGDQRWLVHRQPEGAGVHAAVLGGGELLRAGEVLLSPGERYDAPPVVFVHSEDGLDGVADRLHRRLRRRRSRERVQPVVLNTWEAVYFDHSLPRLAALVERARVVGVERVVLDDGWFAGRRDDTAGLGDWTVDSAVWPKGLDPLVQLVRDAGMQFGLWFEPEMVSPDSDLARTHPEWVLAPTVGDGATFRNQQVLDLSRPGAYRHVLEQISGLVRQYRIDFIKWDHNRELLEAVSRDDGDRPGVSRQTRAFYALLDELERRHPDLEIESCASGGGRVDLGVLDRTSRVWASDCNDPVERQDIQRWTELLIPPELIGSHVGAALSHTTHRTTSLSFRLITAMFASPGFEWDLTECTEAELEVLRVWTAFVKEHRPLLHGGVRVHADLPDPQARLHGTVAEDGSRALFAWVRLSSSADPQLARTPFPGLDANRAYRVRVPDVFGSIAVHGDEPAWMAAARSAAGFTIRGALLGSAGLPLPALHPQSALALHIEAVD